MFTNDKEKSNPEIGTVWKRIGDKMNLNSTEIDKIQKTQQVTGVWQKSGFSA